MTFSLRRKRPTTRRRITPKAAIYSLLSVAWFGSGSAFAQAPEPLKPLSAQTPATKLSEPPPLLPTVRTTLPDMTPAPPSKPVAAPKTLYYQKDAKPVPAIQPVKYQDPTKPAPPPSEAILPPSATETVPPPITKIEVQSESQLFTSIREEVKRHNQSPIFRHFPQDDKEGYRPVSTEPYAARAFEAMVRLVEPNFVCYGRLYFEEKNADRYGWEFGPLQPLVSTGHFVKDYIFLPYHFWTRPCQRYECSAGYCLPGDPVPYLIYPPEFSLTGGIMQAGTVVGLAAIFP